MFLFRRGSQIPDEGEHVLEKLREISEYMAEEAPDKNQAGEAPETQRQAVQESMQVAQLDSGGMQAVLAMQCEELQRQVQALVKERKFMVAQLETERTRVAEVTEQWEHSKQQVKALQTELEAAREKTEETQASHKQELALSARKSQLLSKRLVEISTKLEEPQVDDLDDGHFIGGVAMWKARLHSEGGTTSVRSDCGPVITGVDALKGTEAAAMQLESTRGKVSSFKARWDAMRKEADEAKRRIGVLEGEQQVLRNALEKTQADDQQRRKSFGEIVAKLSDAQNSWNPWKEIDVCKQVADSFKDQNTDVYEDNMLRGG